MTFQLSNRGPGTWLAALALCAFSGGALAQEAPHVKFTTTAGSFVIEVYPDKAPKTVENFLQYVKDKHYDGTIFHRVIDNFVRFCASGDAWNRSGSRPCFFTL